MVLTILETPLCTSGLTFGCRVKSNTHKYIDMTIGDVVVVVDVVRGCMHAGARNSSRTKLERVSQNEKETNGVATLR
jgi:hypothetical protein